MPASPANSPTLTKELLAEFLGTFVLLLIGSAVVASVQLFGKGIPGEVVAGGTTNINLCWGLAVTMGIFTAGKITGAHLNPAVTLTLACFRGFAWGKVLPYWIAQVAGAFAGAALTFIAYMPAFTKADPNLDHTAGVFATFPTFPEMPFNGFLDQIIGTALLLFLIFAITDENNFELPGWATPFAVGLVVVVIGMSFGSLHGYAINPARDFGPRLFTVLAGFSNNGLTDGTAVFLTPLLAPMIGGVLGGGLYDFAIRRNLPE